MATEQRISPYEVARFFMNELQSDRTVQALWYREVGSTVELWLVTEPITHERVLKLHELELLIDEHFPDTDARMHVIHDGLFAGDFHFRAPIGAERYSAQ